MTARPRRNREHVDALFQQFLRVAQACLASYRSSLDLLVMNAPCLIGETIADILARIRQLAQPVDELGCSGTIATLLLDVIRRTSAKMRRCRETLDTFPIAMGTGDQPLLDLIVERVRR